MISTHILDTSRGLPAEGVTVVLERQIGAGWQSLFTEKTNKDGRIQFDCEYRAATYRLKFQTETYFPDAFFPVIPVVFKITDTTRKYHVPLLLNPFGYSTYRGS